MKAKSLRTNPVWTDIKRNIRQTRGGFLALLLFNTLLTRSFLSYVENGSHPVVIKPWDTLPSVPYIADDVTQPLRWIAGSLFLYWIFAFFIVLFLCRYLYDRRKLDLFHALPISRRELLLSRFCTVAIQLFTCAATQVVMLALLLPLLTDRMTFSFWPVVLSILVAYVTALAVTAIFLLCAVSARRLSHYAVYAVGLTILLPAGAVFLLRMPQQHIAGFYWSEAILGYLFPSVNFMQIISGSGNQWLQLCGMAAVCAVILWAAGFVYTRAGKAHASSRAAVRAVQLGIQLFCAAFLSFLMGVMALGDPALKFFRNQPVLAVAALLPVSLFFTIVCERFLADKRKRRAALVQWGCAGVTCLCIACGIQAGISGYAARVPELDQVESVVFTDHEALGLKRSAAVLTWKAAVDAPHAYFTMIQDLLYGRQNVELRGEEGIAAILRLHEESLAFFYNPNTIDCNTTYTVTYRLKDGKELSRSLPYSNNTIDTQYPENVSATHFDYEAENRMVAAYRAAVTTEEFLRAGNPLFLSGSQGLAGLDIYSESFAFFTSETGKESHYYGSIEPSFLDALVSAMQQDLLADPDAGKAGSRLANNKITLYFKKDQWDRLVVKDAYSLQLLFHSSNPGTGESLLFDAYAFNIPDSYTNTVALISQQQY